MYLLSVQYSCVVVSVFLFGGKAYLVWFTLFYSTLLALTDRQTDGWTDRGTTTLASHGLEEPAHALRGLFLIHSLCVGWRNLPTLRVAGGTFFQLCCCVSFWFWREIGFGCTYYYVLGVPYSCGVVLVFLSSVWRCAIIITTKKTKRYSHLSGGCAIIITTKKKRFSCLSGGCAIIITTGKKRYSRLSGGCAIIITTG